MCIRDRESNDYHHSNKVASLGQLVNLYRAYENDHSAAESVKNADLNGVFRVLLGMTAEQFQYQNLQWIFEKFNSCLLYTSGILVCNSMAVDDKRLLSCPAFCTPQ